MGLVNFLRRKPEYIAEPGNIAANEFRALAEILFMEQISNARKVFLVTSTTCGEGKTVTAINLSIMLARLGRKTLLIDANLRKPMISKVFGIDPTPGLMNLANADMELESLKKRIDRYFIDVIPDGGTGGVPLPILSSAGFKACIKKAKDLFDIVILDSPAIATSIDVLILTPLTDGIIFVVMPEQIRKEEILAAKMEIENAKGKIIGVVINNMNDPIPSIVKKML